MNGKEAIKALMDGHEIVSIFGIRYRFIDGELEYYSNKTCGWDLSITTMTLDIMAQKENLDYFELYTPPPAPRCVSIKKKMKFYAPVLRDTEHNGSYKDFIGSFELTKDNKCDYDIIGWIEQEFEVELVDDKRD